MLRSTRRRLRARAFTERKVHKDLTMAFHGGEKVDLHEWTRARSRTDKAFERLTAQE